MNVFDFGKLEGNWPGQVIHVGHQGVLQGLCPGPRSKPPQRGKKWHSGNGFQSGICIWSGCYGNEVRHAF
jgi:hypothetical protein